MNKIKPTLFYVIPILLLILCVPYLKAQDVVAFSDRPCAFCQSDVLEKQKFFENDLVIALYTHKPIFPGHCLIIPKRHVQRFEELSQAEVMQMMEVIKKVHQAVQCTFHTSSYLLLQKNGREVGQTVPHVHFHYIPRETGEMSTLKFLLKMYIANLRKPIDAQAMENITSQLKQAVEH